MYNNSRIDVISFGFGDMYTYENSSGNGVLLADRQIGRRSQGEGCTPATLRTFLQLTISRTSIRSPSERYSSSFRRKGNQFPGKGGLRSFTHPRRNPRNFLCDGSRRIVGERSRGDCWPSRRVGAVVELHARTSAKPALRRIYTSSVRRYHILPGAMRRTGIMPGVLYMVFRSLIQIQLESIRRTA